MQVRLGDAFLSDHACSMDVCRKDVAMYFKCAHEIEEDITARDGGQRPNVVWYFVSDCIGLRSSVKSMFGDKVGCTAAGREARYCVPTLEGDHAPPPPPRPWPNRL